MGMVMVKLKWIPILIMSLAMSAGVVNASEGGKVSPISEYELPASLSSSYAIEVDANSKVWFTEKIGRNLSVFDPANEQFVVYPLPDSWGNVGPSQLSATKDGDIWFTIRRWADDVTDTNILGKFTPSTEEFVRYEISLEASPQEIVADDSGMLWLLATETNKLFSVDPVDAKVTSYEIPTPNSNPQGLTTDQTGDVWFSEPNANQIGRFSPKDGLFQEFKIPTAFSNPGDLAVDAEGKVWFVERASNRIGVLYPDLSRFDEALVPTLNALPHAVEVDDDGRVWFLEYRGNKVGVFSPTQAEFVEFDIPRFNSLPGELVLDSKKELLWFTQSNAESNQLGMLSIKLAGLSPVPVGAADEGAEKSSTSENSGRGGRGEDHTMLIIVLAIVIGIMIAGIWLTIRPKKVGSKDDS